MIQLNEALNRLQAEVLYPEGEEILLEKGLGRVLLEDIDSSIEMPPFDKAAMDGYAINSDDPEENFRVRNVIAAGDPPGTRLSMGEASRIMTGAPVPDGADQVVIREVSYEKDGRVTFTDRSGISNICLRGEDVREGQRILDRGTLMGPAEIGSAAAVGRNRIQVGRIPRVSVLVTGSEIVAPGEPLSPGRIYDSNSASIGAQLRRMGIDPFRVSRIKDTPQKIRAGIEQALSDGDVVVISGGVSMGDFDYVPGILEELGVTLHFSKVAVKPGKPSVFGSRNGKYVFGLPGNPVSTYVIFEIMIKAFLYRMMGHVYEPRMIRARMARPFNRKKTNRTAHIPVRVRDGKVFLPEYHGSAHLFALPGSDGLLTVPVGTARIPAEVEVDVRLI